MYNVHTCVYTHFMPQELIHSIGLIYTTVVEVALYCFLLDNRPIE